MQNQSFSILQPITRYPINPSGLPEIVGSGTAVEAGGANSGIVKGNFKQPNAWVYSNNLNHYWRGRIGILEYDFFGSPSTYYEIDGPYGQICSTPDWERDLIYNEALSKLNEVTRGKLDLSVDIAEAGKTRQMLRETLKAERWFSGIGSKRWANEWLQLQYGWKPLLSSIYGAADESLRYINNRIERFRVRVRKPFSRYSNSASIFGSGTFGTIVDVKGVQGCEFNIRMKVNDFDLSRWTSLNPLSIAWELTPYSFVADWFIDIGSTLRNYETALLYRTAFQGGYVSELYAVRAWEEPSVDSLTLYSGLRPYRTTFFNTTKRPLAFAKKNRFVRTVLTTYPGPRLPGFKADLGWRRLLSAGALLRQRFR